jgi:DNA (cytosine-5)-methyltransferase 1
MARIIHEVQPRFVFVENSPMLTSRGLGRVLGDLAAMGFDAKWGVLGAADVGAKHQRDRIWIVARQCDRFPHAEHYRLGRGEQQQESAEKEIVPDTCQHRLGKREIQHLNRQLSSEANFSADGKEESLANTHDQGSRNRCASANGWAKSWGGGSYVADTNSPQRQGNKRTERIGAKHADIGSSSWWQSEPDVGRVANGVAARVDRLKAIGNGQVPLCAATAWRILSAE